MNPIHRNPKYRDFDDAYGSGQTWHTVVETRRQRGSMEKYNVNLNEITKRHALEVIYMPSDTEVVVSSTDVNRPGLQLSGFYDYFDPERMQIIGRVEHTYLSRLDNDVRGVRLQQLFSRRPPCIILTRGLECYPEMIVLAAEYKVPLLRTVEDTSSFMSGLIAYLNTELGPRITQHGVLVEVYGEGVLILGESGVGKSETAVELLKRGHRLVADDAVEIKRVSNISLVGSAPANIRHFIEIRGIGIINVKRIFGMGSVKDTEKLNLVLKMEAWQESKHYDRLGLVDTEIDILGIKVPLLVIPVKQGRNLAVIVEVAAMNNRQKRMGYNAAEELTTQLQNSLL